MLFPFLFFFSSPFKKYILFSLQSSFVGCGLVLLIRARCSGAGSCLTRCLPAAKLKSPNLSNPFKHWQMKRQHMVENLCSRGSKAGSARARVRAGEAREGLAAPGMPSLGSGDVPGAGAEGFGRGAPSPHEHDRTEGRGCSAGLAHAVLFRHARCCQCPGLPSPPPRSPPSL